MATNVSYPQPVTVGTAAVQVTFNGPGIPNGVLLLQRNADAGSVYIGIDNTVSTTTGALVAKGIAGQAAPTPLPPTYFKPGGTYASGFWLISGTASQTVDVWPG